MGLLALIFGFFAVLLLGISDFLRSHPIFTLLMSLVIAIVLVKGGVVSGN